MQIQGSRVAVIGGSVAGCSAAIALTRAGCEVTVFEQIVGLGERGFSIGTPVTLREELIEKGYLPADYPTLEIAKRWWTYADGTPRGRVIWEQATRAATNNWGLLWRHLRQSADAATFRDGIRIETIEPREDGVRLITTDGEAEDFDILVGADGYKSQVRGLMNPDAAPSYAGYVVWRGSYPESRVGDRTLIDRMTAEGAFPTVVFDEGIGSIHQLPGSDGRTEPGARRVNFAVYAKSDPKYDYSEPNSIPPGAIGAEQYGEFETMLERCFPEEVATMVRNCSREETSIQPIYDLTVDRYVQGRMMLIGDAGAVTRPHTASGATKAMMDALLLEKIAGEGGDWDEVLRTYDEERTEASNKIVELSRRLGEGQVLDPPDWSRMAAEDFPDWIESMMDGQRLYLFADAQQGGRPAS
jgi:2-polyprenyl-6-methoxyphenol hydroxylase-like FAD-dependent oxidoreductase